jgi:NADPH-dependent ferric siderophore reductase
MTTTSEAVRSPVGAFDVEVVRTQRLSPTFLRVTFGGASLHDFLDHGPLGPRDLRVKLVVPVGSRRPLDVRDLSDGWYQRWRALDPRERGVMRTYTVRRTRLGGPDPQIDVDFVLHVDETGCGGPACTWAAAARPGDRITLIGPAAGAEGYGGIEWRPPRPSGLPPTRVLLVGDETAVPAVCSILEGLPPGYVGHAVLEVPSHEDFSDVRSASAVDVRWLARGGRPRGELVESELRDLFRGAPTPAPVQRAVVSHVDVDEEILWEVSAGSSTRGSGVHAWVAGEAGMVRDVRRQLVGELGVDRARVAFMGYWREGRTEAS